MAGPVLSDAALFEELENNKKKKKKRRIIIISCVAAFLILAVAIGVFFARRAVRKNFGPSIGDVVSYSASRGSISTTVSGSGQLADVDKEEISVPANVTVEDVPVKANDRLKSGDVIAKVDLASVLAAMSDVQKEINSLDTDIGNAEYDTVSSYITAGVNGRVKKVYVQKGDGVSECMYKNGALALISLDGFMSFDAETDALHTGDKVSVRRSDEAQTVIEGTVELSSAGKATVLVKDTQADCGEILTVVDENDREVCSGEAYIHNRIKVTGITGTVSSVGVSEGSYVYAGGVICTLTDTAYTGNYDNLVAERQEKEETLAELIRIYADGALTAKNDCLVCTVDYDESSVSEDQETAVATVSPGEKMSVTINVDESAILSLEKGQQASVSVPSIGDEAIEGTVTEINRTATASSNITRYTAVLEMDRTEGMLSGMTASASVRIQGVDNAVIIPIEALHQTSSKTYVYTAYDENTGEFGGIREVEAGIQNSSYAEIISGLSEGETVYYTETENSAFNPMNFGGGQRPSDGFNGEQMPSGDFGGMPGGGMSGGGPRGGMPGGGPGGRRS